jgi:hypothetical protein
MSMRNFEIAALPDPLPNPPPFRGRERAEFSAAIFSTREREAIRVRGAIMQKLKGNGF